MKQVIPALLAVLAVGGFTAILVNRNDAARCAREIEHQRAAWEAEKAELQAALEAARNRPPRDLSWAQAPVAIAAPAQPDARELLRRLVETQATTGSPPGRHLRKVLAGFEKLVEIGPPALPAIREFLASGQDTIFTTPSGKASLDMKAITGALVPPTLRLGLFEVVREIGGPDAESVLAETLGGTVRGLEAACLAELLEEMAPGKYRDLSLATARSLLAGAATDRDQLFGILKRFDDRSYVNTAQANLVQADGKVDRSALRYLQQTLGEQSVAVAAQYYQDPRLTEAGTREPLARLALAYVGANPQASELFHSALLDPSLLPNQKRELIEDLNQDGLSNTKTPTPQDLKLITERYALTQAYLQQEYIQSDKILNAAFHEADKDLRNMLQRAATAAGSRPGQ